jgi:actin-related protein
LKKEEKKHLSEIKIGNKGLIFDFGSENSKIGFEGEKKPEFIFPSIFGKKDGKCFFGDEVEKNGILSEKAINRGLFKNFEIAEKVN